MGKNFQDVLRDVYNEPAHALQTVGSAAATIFAVVNTGAATDSLNNIGFATVAVSTPTLYAVVNTSAAGLGNSIVTVANPNFGINAGVNGIGFATVNVVNQPALVGSAAFIGLVTVANTVPVTFAGNVTITDSKGYIGLTSVSGTVGLGAGTLNIGSVSVLGGAINSTLQSSTLNVGSVSVLGGTIAVSSLPALVTSTVNIGSVSVLGGVINANLQSGTLNIGSVSILGGKIVNDTSTLNIGSVSVLGGTIAVSSLPALVASTVNIGSVSILGGKIVNDTSTLNIGSVSVLGGTINAVPQTSTLNIGSVSVLGGTINSTLNAGVAGIGFATVFNATAWPDPKTYIGLVTITGSLAAASGNITITDGKTFIGSVSVTGVVGLNTGTLNIGSVSILGGTILANLNTGTLNIGSVSILGGKIVNDTSTLNIGSVSVLGGTINAVLQSSTLNVGSVSILGGKIVNDTSTLNIGSVSILGGGIGLNAGVNGIGFATVKVDAGTQFIGLVTAVTRNAGTLKTLLNLPITGLSKAGSIATIAVPTNAQSIYITNFVINSDATVNVRIKSGVTYMNGNASLGITLNPGGGFVMSGAPDSPSWIGLPSGALVIEKFDMTGTIANLGGNVVYFQE